MNSIVREGVVISGRFHGTLRASHRPYIRIHKYDEDGVNKRASVEHTWVEIALFGHEFGAWVPSHWSQDIVFDQWVLITILEAWIRYLCKEEEKRNVDSGYNWRYARSLHP